MSKWYIKNGKESDVVASVRVRLARNLKGYPFPNKMTLEQKCEVIQKVSDAILNGNSAISGDFKFIDMDKISRIEAYSMVERHLISPDFAENGQGRALLLLNDESVSIMINEEDHIRIQVMAAGLDFEAAYDIANKIDVLLESNMQFAFDENLGYLTECPTNLGTGMRASAMLHIPALEAAGAVGQLSNTISKIGLTMRGTYGEGSKIKCAMYQVSNQVTLGISETAAIENLQGIIKQIMERERQTRLSIDHDNLEDTVYRAYGVLKSARLMSGNEFFDLVSQLRLGVGMGIIDTVAMETVNELILKCQPASLQNTAGGPLDADTRDKLRARIVRETLA
ncbi:MAG: protein arginine kinase [Clostridia bacterium]|nr:protein arginine kinase [Clostridia bacterium]